MDRTKTKSPFNFISSEEETYTPLQQFKDKVHEGLGSPYQTRLSFNPLLEKWKRYQKDGDKVLAPTVVKMLSEIEEKLGTGEIKWSDLQSHPEFMPLMPVIFPSLFDSEGLGFITVPLTKDFAYQSPKFLDMMASGEWDLVGMTMTGERAHYHMVFTIAVLILNRFYDQNLDLGFSEIFTIEHRETKLKKHFKISVVLDYVEVELLKPLRKLTDDQIQNLINNMEDRELWLDMFPIDNFSFSGFVPGYTVDVTEMEVLSVMRRMLAVHEEKSPDQMLSEVDYIQGHVRSYMGDPQLLVGCMPIAFELKKEEVDWSLLRLYRDVCTTEEIKEFYFKVSRKDEALLINDLSKVKHPSAVEKAFREAGMRSLLMTPLIDRNNQVIGIFEMASPQPGRLNQLTVMKIREVVALFSLGVERQVIKIHNQVQGVIQDNFTAIHPSVQWKFQEVATQYIFDSQFRRERAVLAPIVFEDLNPLYGQADIVGSSQLRNASIQEDLIDNLERCQKVLKACLEKVEYHLLEVYSLKIKELLAELKVDHFDSKDETQLVEFLTQEVHPLLRTLSERFKQAPKKKIKSYFKYLDPDLDIVYRHRRDYEESVRQLNLSISRYLEEEDQKMQSILPHFFEKYKTDGVEYNLYLGQSILKTGEFSDFDLKNFRLWQLFHMVEIAKLVDRNADHWPIALQTAQLIFVYSHPLTIRFRMDEKQFDVDGAYNVRYEILKKRIDKGVIKGTKERLTQPGKIAIVWLQEKDRLEYLEYLSHLQEKGLIEDEIEEMELEELQGAKGLQALRVTVKMDE